MTNTTKGRPQSARHVVTTLGVAVLLALVVLTTFRTSGVSSDSPLARDFFGTVLSLGDGVLVVDTRDTIVDVPFTSSLRHMAAYMSSKAGVVQLTEILSGQLTDTGIQVNAMSPGGSTRMLQEVLESTEEIGDAELTELTQRVISEDPIERSAELATFLASDDSNGLSGRVISHRDEFESLSTRIPEIMASDAYTLRLMELD